MEVVDNNSDHYEVLDAAITYKIDGTYPSNSSKIGKGQFEREQSSLNSIITIIQVLCPDCTYAPTKDFVMLLNYRGFQLFKIIANYHCTYVYSS